MRKGSKGVGVGPHHIAEPHIIRSTSASRVHFDMLIICVESTEEEEFVVAYM